MPKERPDDLADIVLDLGEMLWVTVPTAPSTVMLVDRKQFEEWLDPEPDDESPPEYSEPGYGPLYDYWEAKLTGGKELIVNLGSNDDYSGNYYRQDRQSDFFDYVIPLCEKLGKYISIEQLMDKDFKMGRDMPSSLELKARAAIAKGTIRPYAGKIQLEKGVTGGPIPAFVTDFGRDDDDERYRNAKFIFHDARSVVLGMPSTSVKLDSNGMIERLRFSNYSARSDLFELIDAYDGEELAWALEQLGAKGFAPRFLLGDGDYAEMGLTSDLLTKTAAVAGWQLPAPKKENVRRPSQGFIHLLEMRRRAKWRT